MSSNNRVRFLHNETHSVTDCKGKMYGHSLCPESKQLTVSRPYNLHDPEKSEDLSVLKKGDTLFDEEMKPVLKFVDFDNTSVTIKVY